MNHGISIRAPLTDDLLATLHAGDSALINGVIYTARDAAHKRLIALMAEGKPLPFDVKGQIIYYVGPTPPRPGKIIGSAGPTTASRMDSTTLPLLEAGLKATVGKGGRSKEVRDAMVKHKAIYLAAFGGAGAFLARCIKKVEIIAYPELGTEAIRRLEVEDFPAVVVNDIYGNDLYETVKKQSQRN